MVSQLVTWVPLPYHRENGTLHISVFVAVRLANDTPGDDTPRTLGEFDDFVDWPAITSGLGFDIEFGPEGSTQPDAVVPGLIPTNQPDSEAWTRIFPADTFVRPREFEDNSQHAFLSYPVGEVLSFLQETYGSVGAAAPTDPPSIDLPEGPLAAFDPLSGVVERVRRSVRREDPYRQVESGSLPGSAQAPFFQARRFYFRPENHPENLEDEMSKVVESSPVPEHDFHEILALLGDWPAVLRILGIVLDFAVDDPGIEPEGWVRVRPQGAIPAGSQTALTRYQAGDEYFVPRPRSAITDRGLLRLSPEFFVVYQVDVDGAAIKVTDFADTLGRLRDESRRTHVSPAEAAVPALRSGGLSVARHRRGADLLDELQAAAAKNPQFEVGLEPDLDGVDLLRGFRIDIRDDEGVWHSLQRRAGTHTIPGGGSAIELVVDDEAYVKATAVTSARDRDRPESPRPAADVYVHEAVFGWDGWSLAVPRPGKRIVEPGEGENESDIATHDPDEGNPTPIQTSLQVVPGTLPRLRFGHAYRIRVRLVDLAGNSRPFAADDLEKPEEGLVSDEETYRRFEPVTGPVVLRSHRDTEGESLERLVIRSNFDIDAAGYVASADVVAALAAVDAAHEYTPSSVRQIAPPKTSQQMAEQLGAFDFAIGKQPDANGAPAPEVVTALRMAMREEGTFLDADMIDLTPGQPPIAQPGLTIVGKSDSLPQERGEGLPEGSYPIYPEPVLVPYLPDPMAAGVAFTGFPGTGPGALRAGPWAGEWPEMDPMRIELVDGGSGPSQATFADGVLTVALAKADVFPVRVSSYLAGAAALDKLAIWDWIRRRVQAGDALDELEEVALDGRHWMLTPSRTLTFVHAVQQPLSEPLMDGVEPFRRVGNTFAAFRGPIANSAKSTDRIDVHAQWTEDVDLLTDDAPRMRATGDPVVKDSVAFGFDLGADEDAAQVSLHDAELAGGYQSNWRRCAKCRGLVFGPSGGVAKECPAGGRHLITMAGDYTLAVNNTDAPGQSNWRSCNKCGGLWFGGNPAGPCPAGSTHGGPQPPRNYTVPYSTSDALGEPGWRWCQKCQGMAHGAVEPGACPAGGVHDHSSSKEYTLARADRVSRHELGDTKYRRIRYHAVATTRFREYFPTSITDDPQRIQRVGPSVELDILSTARPAAPDVVYVVPTFEWLPPEVSRAGETHVRKGNGVRVYLRRPWFSSGDGEMLGVVIRKPSVRAVVGLEQVDVATTPLFAVRRAGEDIVTSEPGMLRRIAEASSDAVSEWLGRVDMGHSPAPPAEGDPLRSYVTEWGLDPVWASASPKPRPAVGHFPRRVGHATNLTLDEVPPQHRVAVVAHDVQYDGGPGGRKLWYCDIDVDLGDTYFPFIRFALARYQPMSLPDCHLSRVIMTDFIQVAPDRTATVTRRRDAAAVKVVGYAGRNVVKGGSPRTAPNTRMRAYLERRPAGSQSDMAWTPVTEPVDLSAKADGHHVSWSGTVGIGSLSPHFEHRISIREYEVYKRDWDTAVDGESMLANPAAAYGLEERIVYADEFILSSEGQRRR